MLHTTGGCNTGIRGVVPKTPSQMGYKALCCAAIELVTSKSYESPMLSDGWAVKILTKWCVL